MTYDELAERMKAHGFKETKAIHLMPKKTAPIMLATRWHVSLVLSPRAIIPQCSSIVALINWSAARHSGSFFIRRVWGGGGARQAIANGTFRRLRNCSCTAHFGRAARWVGTIATVPARARFPQGGLSRRLELFALRLPRRSPPGQEEPCILQMFRFTVSNACGA
ncbi:hypothetical protein [Mesorhizobium sp. B2-8-5]|uniref:hypothetical protein n=1 Tax=Mesorhizobium sp. B2-8-5 TaxID=2589903 RepID=UPI0039B0126F